MLNCNIFATFFAIMMKIGPVTVEIVRVETAPFWTRLQKSAYHTKYLTKYVTDRHQHLNIGRHVYYYKTYISFAIAKGMLLC